MGIQKNSQAFKPLNAFVLGNGKNQKNSQTVSFWILWQGGRETQKKADGESLVLVEKGEERQKEFRRLVLGEFFLAKGEENEKMNSTSFQGWKTRKLQKAFGTKKKKKFKEISRLVKDWLEKQKVLKIIEM